MWVKLLEIAIYNAGVPASATTPSLRAFFWALFCALAASATATSPAMLFLPVNAASPPCVSALAAFSAAYACTLLSTCAAE